MQGFKYFYHTKAVGCMDARIRVLRELGSAVAADVPIKDL